MAKLMARKMTSKTFTVVRSHGRDEAASYDQQVDGYPESQVACIVDAQWFSGAWLLAVGQRYGIPQSQRTATRGPRQFGCRKGCVACRRGCMACGRVGAWGRARGMASGVLVGMECSMAWEAGAEARSTAWVASQHGLVGFSHGLGLLPHLTSSASLE